MKNLYFALSGTAISIFGWMITLGAASRYISSTELGVCYLVFVLSAVGLALTSIGGSSAVISLAEDHRFQGKLTMDQPPVTVKAVTVALLVLAIGLLIWGHDMIMPGTVFGELKWVILLVILMEMVTGSGLSTFAGLGRFRTAGVLHGLKGIFSVAASLLVLVMGFGFEGFLWSLVFTGVCMTILVWYSIPVRFSFSFELPTMRQVTSASSMLYLAYLVSILSVKSAEGMIVVLSGAAALAVYGNALLLPTLLIRMFEAVRPFILDTPGDMARSGQYISMRTTSAVIAVMAGLLMVFAHPLTLMIFGETYLPCVPITRLLCFWVVLSLVNYFLVIYSIDTGQIRKVLGVNGLGFAVAITGNWFLIPEFGVTGAALALTLTSFLTILISLLILSSGRVLSVSGLVVSFYKSILPLFALCAALQATAPGLNHSMLYWVLFVLSMLGLKAVPVQDFKSAVRTMRYGMDTGSHAAG